jgi:putative methyltransferase (TIGR04325 family)
LSNLISDWLPPIIRKYLTSKKWKFEGDYKLWEEAKMNCVSYNSNQVVTGMKYRHELWLESYKSLIKSNQSKYLDLNSRNILSQFFFPLLELNKNIVTVLDIGGATGGHFTIVRDNVPNNITLLWTINETITAVNEFTKSFPQTNL